MKSSKRILTLSIILLICLLLQSAQAVLMTIGAFQPDAGVYQVGTTGVDQSYREAKNSYDDGVVAYHFVTQDPAKAGTSTVTYRGVTYDVTTHVLPTMDAGAYSATKTGLGSLTYSANTTWFFDSGIYRNDTEYYQFSQPNLSLVALDEKPVFIRVSTSSQTPTKLERTGFAQPNIYIDGIIFDGGGRDMQANKENGAGGNRGEYFIMVNSNLDGFVMRNSTIQNVGATNASGWFDPIKKNVALNIIYFLDNDGNMAEQANIEGITFTNIKTTSGHGLLSTNQSSIEKTSATGEFTREEDLLN